jgi:hypothetical protein
MRFSAGLTKPSPKHRRMTGTYTPRRDYITGPALTGDAMQKLISELLFSKVALSKLFPSLVENVAGCIGLLCLAWALRARQLRADDAGFGHDPLGN